ncbi:endonuclease domain-containing protein [Streptomyces xanthochromogenes]|uniref:endonuclease domain-containing protein n=1 Tax=Streptomyces xanthochromogenes TaxID=67384 RepID=UPI0038058279
MSFRKTLRDQGKSECVICGQVKLLSEFTKFPNGLPLSYCKPCNTLQRRLRNFGISIEFYQDLLDYQGGVCAICRGVDSGRTDSRGRSYSMCIDHDHRCCPQSGRGCVKCVRGIVCNECNTRGLRWYEALPTELRRFDLLNNYLNNPPAKSLRVERGSR